MLDGKPFASHLPLYLDRKTGSHGALIGHMARANPHWQAMQQGCEVLGCFMACMLMFRHRGTR
jgi:predicted FMN-binding regulatory protein PaiB